MVAQKNEQSQQQEEKNIDEMLRSLELQLKARQIRKMTESIQATQA